MTAKKPVSRTQSSPSHFSPAAYQSDWTVGSDWHRVANADGGKVESGKSLMSVYLSSCTFLLGPR
jgi:hypothetical protein